VIQEDVEQPWNCLSVLAESSPDGQVDAGADFV
jgi:hypothetical protein